MPAFTTQTGAGAMQATTLATIQSLVSMSFPTQGNIWFVSPYSGDDNNPGTAALPFKTLGQALSMATANQNDIVYLLATSNTASHTTNYLSANLNWNKDGVHLIGVNAGPLLGQRSRIAPLSTATAFADMFTVSANGCLISNIEFFQGQMATNPTAASTAVKVTGQRNRFINCQISGIGHSDLDDSGSNSLTITGAENTFEHCYIGLDTVIRATSVTEVIISGTPARINFENCLFETYTSSTSFKIVSVGTGVDRFVRFRNCDFHAVQNITSSAKPSGALGVTTLNGDVLVINCSFAGITQITTADNAYTQVLGLDGTATGHLISITQGVDAA